MTTESFTPGDLLLDGPSMTRAVTIKSGADVVRGAVLGRITTGGKYILSDDGASDGSEDPVAIAAEDIEASSADGTGLVWVMGNFDAAKLTFGGTHDADSVETAFRTADLPIRLKTLA